MSNGAKTGRSPSFSAFIRLYYQVDASHCVYLPNKFNSEVRDTKYASRFENFSNATNPSISFTSNKKPHNSHPNAHYHNPSKHALLPLIIAPPVLSVTRHVTATLLPFGSRNYEQCTTSPTSPSHNTQNPNPNPKPTPHEEK